MSIPPEQRFPAVTETQFTPVPPVAQISPAPLFPLYQQQPYIQYHTLTHGPASYYQEDVPFMGSKFTWTIPRFSLNDGNRSATYCQLYNKQELPYVINLFHFRVQSSFKQQVGPAFER